MVSIGVICPIGRLDRFGYHRTARLSFETLSRVADRLYVCSSSPQDERMRAELAGLANVTMISEPRTWFERDMQGREVFDIARLDANLAVMVEACRSDGHDCAIEIHVNQYVPERSGPRLRDSCERLVASGRPFEWLYKRYQLGAQLFDADIRVPWILNLRVATSLSLLPDSLQTGDEVVPLTIGDYARHNDVALIDAPLELTIEELWDKMEFVGQYADIRGRAIASDRDALVGYYTTKFRSKWRSDARLDATGMSFAAAGGDDAVSGTVLERLPPRPGLLRTLRRRLIRP